MKIDPTLHGRLPKVQAPIAWKSKDGSLKGWKVTIPGNRPLATPALADRKIFLGGGFGSYEFYAFDAQTGKVVWQYQTEDDGPTAAVVYEKFVAFNTESCELEIVTLDGQRMWKKWLGDPLMSMPALHDGRVFQVYPDSRGDHRHYLAAFDLADGRELWRQPLSGEIITAPVLVDGHVHVANLDGTLSCFRQDNGATVWQESKNATSSPVVWEGKCYFSQRQEVVVPNRATGTVQQTEMLAKREHDVQGTTSTIPGTVANADWLDHAKRKKSSRHYATQAAYDAGVGFCHSKGDAKMYQAEYHLGHGHVSGLWAYQGSKPFIYRSRLYSAVGDTLHAIDPHSKKVFWKKRLHVRKDDEEVLDHVLTPTALVNGRMFVGTILGAVCCLTADSGEVLWRADVGEPVLFQPAVAAGRVYAGTAKGSLFCLETDDAKDDGWNMWGGDACHNGLAADMGAAKA
jgi:outer membrane protein assembly factor BamB